MRGFVIDGPFMVFGDGMQATGDVANVAFPDKLNDSFEVDCKMDDYIRRLYFKPMTPEQERDYKPMFPSDEPIAYPVMNQPQPYVRPVTEDDVTRFLDGADYFTFKRVLGGHRYAIECVLADWAKQ
jgi:hypothetical protein